MGCGAEKNGVGIVEAFTYSPQAFTFYNVPIPLSVSRSFVQSSLVMAAPADLSASSSAAVASPASGAVVVAPSPRPPKPKRPKQPPSFAVCKRNALSKLDKSPKGSIDAPILPLVRALYGHAGYVTTSSCSGRIALYETSGRAPNGRWALVEHRRVFTLFESALAS